MTKEPIGWEPPLRTWSQEWLTSAEFASTLPEEVISSGWLGCPGASKEPIASAEQRLGQSPPPSFRNFLRVTDGWSTSSRSPSQIRSGVIDGAIVILSARKRA